MGADVGKQQKEVFSSLFNKLLHKNLEGRHGETQQIQREIEMYLQNNFKSKKFTVK